MNMDKDMFQTYINFKAQFLQRFTDLNPSETAVKRLINIKQRKQLIQKYYIKILNLAKQTNLENQAAKALIFRRFYLKDQKRVMMANSLKSKKKLMQKTLKKYLKRTERLLRQKKVY